MYNLGQWGWRIPKRSLICWDRDCGICTLLQGQLLPGGRETHLAGQFCSATFSPGSSQKTIISGISPLGTCGFFMGLTSSNACWPLSKNTSNSNVSFSEYLKCQSSTPIFMFALG